MRTSTFCSRNKKANMRKKRTIRYLGVDPVASLLAQQKILKYYSVNTEGASIKLYFNSLVLLARLSKDQLVFLFFLFTIASPAGQFRHNRQMRIDFEGFSERAVCKRFSKRTISRWLAELSELEILGKVNKSRGIYILSPAFFGLQKDQEYNERERQLRKTLEHPIRFLASKFRAEALSEKELYEILKDVAQPPPSS